MIDSRNVNILSFDLGSSFGYAYSAFVDNSKFIVKEGDTVDLTLGIRLPEFNNIIDDKRKKLILFERYVTNFLNNYNVDVVVAEDIFQHIGRPEAFKSLLLYMETLERTVFNIKTQTVFKIPPNYIKMIVAGHGHADKADVQTALFQLSDIEFKKTSILKNMTSHLSDSIAVGYTFSRSLSSGFIK